MKTTIIYYIFNMGNKNEWRVPYKVSVGLAKQLIDSYPETYFLAK